MMNKFNAVDYKEQITTFPQISYSEFELITDIKVRKDIVKRNRILMTDTYNRTMEHTKGEEKSKEIETFTLAFRKSPNNTYNVVHGIRSMIKDVFEAPITQAELDFAKDFYSAQAARWWVNYFNAQVRQDIIDKGGYIPLEIKAVPDWTAMKIKEPVMAVSGASELAARFEPIFLRTFYPSAVATGAHIIEEILGTGRVAEFGMRSWFNNDSHFDAVEACIIGMDLKATSNDMAAAVYPQTHTSWTTAHRFYACYKTEDEAFETNIQNNEKVALLIDLADSYSGIRKAVTLKKKYRHTNKPIAMRLDSGDLADQAIYALTMLAEAWMNDPMLDKVIIADISSVEQLIEIENKIAEAGFDPKKYIVYGLGWLLVAKEKTRDQLSGWYKLTHASRWPTGKLSNDAGKEPIPGKPNVEIRDNKRVVVQEDEEVQGKRLLKPIYHNGSFYFDTDNDLKAIDNARDQLVDTIKYIWYETIESPLTQKIHEEVRNNIMANIR